MQQGWVEGCKLGLQTCRQFIVSRCSLPQLETGVCG